MFLCLLFLLAVVPIVSGGELSIVATADSYTESDYPDVNHGGVSTLYSYNCEYELLGYIISYERHIWLKFDLSEIPSDAKVKSAILRMHTSIIGVTSTNKVGVFLCSHSDWQELEITWNNSPQVTEQSIDIVYVASPDTYYDFDVTSAVKGRSVITLVLKTLEPTDLFGWAAFDSRETGGTIFGEYRPRLTVEYTIPPLTVDFPPWVFQSLIIGSIVIAVVGIPVVGILIGYAVTSKKKQRSALTKVCPQCGRMLSPALKFCPYCGKAL